MKLAIIGGIGEIGDEPNQNAEFMKY